MSVPEFCDLLPTNLWLFPIENQGANWFITTTEKYTAALGPPIAHKVLVMEGRLILWICVVIFLSACTATSSNQSISKSSSSALHQQQPAHRPSGLRSIVGSAHKGDHEVGRKRKHIKSLSGHLLHELSHGKIKALVVGVSALLVFLEVFDEIAEKVPFLERVVGHRLASVHHGVFLLTLSHFITTISEIIKTAEESAEVKHELKVDDSIHKLSHKSFSSEEEAAKAFDEVAVSAYGRGAATNFPISVFKSHIVLDSQGRLPSKQSKFRGVVWDNDLGAWRVPASAFGHE